MLVLILLPPSLIPHPMHTAALLHACMQLEGTLLQPWFKWLEHFAQPWHVLSLWIITSNNLFHTCPETASNPTCVQWLTELSDIISTRLCLTVPLQENSRPVPFEMVTLEYSAPSLQSIFTVSPTVIYGRRRIQSLSSVPFISLGNCVYHSTYVLCVSRVMVTITEYFN